VHFPLSLTLGIYRDFPTLSTTHSIALFANGSLNSARSALHATNLKSVIETSVAVVASSITSIAPPTPRGGAVYSVSRIAYIIGGTVALFAVVVGLFGLATKYWRPLQRMSQSIWKRLLPRRSYEAFRSSSAHDLGEFRLDEDEVTVELHNI